MATDPSAVPAQPDDTVEFSPFTDEDDEPGARQTRPPRTGPEPAGIWNGDFWLVHYLTR